MKLELKLSYNKTSPSLQQGEMRQYHEVIISEFYNYAKNMIELHSGSHIEHLHIDLSGEETEPTVSVQKGAVRKNGSRYIKIAAAANDKEQLLDIAADQLRTTLKEIEQE